jgi:hypothetical protein
VDASRLGPELERLPGVLAATVVPELPGGTRVYVAVRRQVDAAAVLANTLALLKDRGVTADPDRVHVGVAPDPTTAPNPVPTLHLDSLDVSRAGNRVECTVRLRTPARTIAGTASEPDTATGRARAAAAATLAAVESLDPDLRLGLIGARPHSLFGFDTIAVLIEASAGRQHFQLPGSAIIERSTEHAAALATLQALRGWIP